MKLRQVGILILITLSGCVHSDDNNLALDRTAFHSSSVDDNQCGHLVADVRLFTYRKVSPI